MKCLALLAKSCPSNKYATHGLHFSVSPRRSHFWRLKKRAVKGFGPLSGYIRTVAANGLLT